MSLTEIKEAGEKYTKEHFAPFWKDFEWVEGVLNDKYLSAKSKKTDMNAWILVATAIEPDKPVIKDEERAALIQSARGKNYFTYLSKITINESGELILTDAFQV
jgi:hypothetical protein